MRGFLRAAIAIYVVAEFFLTPDLGLVQSHAQSAPIVPTYTIIVDQFGNPVAVNKDGSLTVNPGSAPSPSVGRASGCASVSSQEVLALPTPPAGMFTYVTSLYFEEVADATGGTAQTGGVWQDVNMTAASATTTIIKTSFVGTASTAQVDLQQSYSPPWKSAAPGQTISFKSPTGATHTLNCITVTFYIGP